LIGTSGGKIGGRLLARNLAALCDAFVAGRAGMRTRRATSCFSAQPGSRPRFST
jgi:hypothetical protein